MRKIEKIKYVYNLVSNGNQGSQLSEFYSTGKLRTVQYTVVTHTPEVHHEETEV
jgi:hypothetical protein